LNDKAITPQGMQNLRDQIQQLETTARREVAERIKTAREWGDLKENAEYHDAKNDQGFLEAKIARLKEQLRDAVAVDAPAGNETVAFGSTVELVNVSNDSTLRYTLVGSTEADAGSGKISSESPVAKALIGARVGETVAVQAPSGELQLKVLAVS
jgi:transcription elongation factor GreA